MVSYCTHVRMNGVQLRPKHGVLELRLSLAKAKSLNASTNVETSNVIIQSSLLTQHDVWKCHVINAMLRSNCTSSSALEVCIFGTLLLICLNDASARSPTVHTALHQR